MKESFIHEYLGFGRVPSVCNVIIDSIIDGEYLICFEDRGHGTSVTNASEQIASEIVFLKKFNPAKCRFFETYPEYNYDTFDEIIYEWKVIRERWIAESPDWKPAPENIKNLFCL